MAYGFHKVRESAVENILVFSKKKNDDVDEVEI